MNPLRAGMVNHPEEYPWSSFRFNALGKGDPLITTHSIYNALGDDAPKRQSTYRGLFEHHVPERTIEEIRAATNKANKAWVLGNDRFQDQIEKLSRRQVKPKPRGAIDGLKNTKKKRVYAKACG